MKKWSTQEKIMLVIIIMLAIGIAIRWGFVKKEVSDTVSGYFGSDSTRTEQTE